MPSETMLGAVAMLTLGLGVTAAQAADPFRVEYSFNCCGVTPTGADTDEFPGPLVGYHTPGQPLTWALYGMGSGGPGCFANSGCGVVFKVSPPPPGTGGSWTETTLYQFDQTTFPNEAYSYGPLVFDRSGATYGTSVSGGTYRNGTVYADGAYGYGAVFKLAPPLAGSGFWNETLLHSFQGGADGAFPSGGVILDSTGALYGTAASTYDPYFGYLGGVVFKLTPPASPSGAWSYSVLHSFPKGPTPSSTPLLMGPGGELYGTTAATTVAAPGVSTFAAVFRLTPPTTAGGSWSYEALYSLGNQLPQAPLIRDASGSLYGAAIAGGLVPTTGAVFRLDPPAAGRTAWTQTVLHSFSDNYTATTSWIPQGLTASGGAFYGPLNGGTIDGGAIFRLSPPPAHQTTWSYSVVHSFGEDGFQSPGGARPNGNLVLDAMGNLYGAARDSGVLDGGTVFKLFTQQLAAP